MPSPGDERTVERWTIYPCPIHGLRTGPDETMHPLHNYCWRCDQLREGPSSYPADPVEVVPVSHLPSEPSPEAERRYEQLQRESAEWSERVSRSVRQLESHLPLPSEPSPEAIEAATLAIFPNDSVDVRGVSTITIDRLAMAKAALRAAYSKERELAERGTGE